jgi:5-formyltetrahydrofolate cyclo-ligase
MDATLLATLAEVVRARAPHAIAGYAPIGGEPGGPALPEVLSGGGVPVLLPVLRDDLDLDWAPYHGPQSLHPGPRGLREPDTPRLGVSAIAGVDLVVVPALAVDVTGVRLGRGGGSYDRALARVPESTLVVALLYDGELVDRLPADPHDRPVRAVVTPSAGLVVLPAVVPHTPAGRAGGP